MAAAKFSMQHAETFRFRVDSEVFYDENPNLSQREVSNFNGLFIEQVC